jgi:class 3 adenylate cyclase
VTAAFCSACGFALQDGVARAGTAEAREERRVVSVLFADLAGSTALGERLEPEDVRELQGELFEFLNAEVERHGGMTEKFVGDAVMALFGVPHAHEDDVERALRTALALRDAFPDFAARVRDQHGAEVGLRIGVNTGEVVSGREAAARGELVVSGDAVNVAARLQQRAAPGEILAGARTRAGAQRAVVFDGPLGVEAKGKEDPIEAWRAVRLTERPVRRGLEGLSAPLIGRDTELAVLTAVAGRVRAEQAPQLVTLFGPAGVGKSRLLAELIDQAGDARLLKGRCLPYGDGITYWPLAEVAKSHAGVLETDSAEVVIEKLAVAVGTIVPDEHAHAVVDALSWTLGTSLPGTEPTGFASADVRGRLYDAWARYVAALGRDRYTILTVEDIHWASSPLLDLLEHLAETLDETSVLIVCPARPELLDSRPGWGAGMRNATALSLQPLAPDDARRLVSELLHVDAVGEEARARILERAEGNPFFVEEILRMLIDQGALEKRDGGWVAAPHLADIPLPDSVHGVIAARIDLLDAEPREALRRCAVMGRVFWPAAVGVEEDVVSSLARRGLVSEQPASVVAGMREFTFKHSLTRDVAYHTLPRPERRVLHRRVADWVEHVAPGRYAEMGEIAAYHYLEAVRYGDDDPDLATHAFELLLSAADAALARAALTSADSLFGQALELATDEGGRARALLGLGRTATGTARYDEALTLLREARALAHAVGAITIESDVVGWLTRVSWLAGRWDDAVALANEAIAILDGLPESPELARALARRSQIEMLRGMLQAEEHAREAIEVAQRVGDRFAEANARINLSTAASLRGKRPDEKELLDVVAMAVAAGAYDEGFRAVVNYLWSAQSYVSIPELEQSVDDALSLLGDVQQIESYDEYLRLSRAKFLLVPMGRWELVAPILAGPECTSGAGSRMVWLELLAGMALRRGDLARADALLPELRRSAIASEEPQRILPMAGVVLPRAALAGDRATAAEVVGAILDLPGRMLWTLLVPSAIPRALAQVGDIDSLRRFDGHLGHGTVTDQVRITRSTSRGFLALADGEPLVAVEAFREEVELERSRGADYHVACAEIDLAAALEAAGDVDRAAATRASARTMLDALGCVNPF